MNKLLLHPDTQNFIETNLNSDIASLLLKGINFDNIDSKLIIEQIESKKRSEKKLPTWFNTKSIYYPNKLNIEQTSSEATAKHKASLISGQSIIDLTGGFGVDTYYFNKRVKNCTHCEINKELSNIVNYNYGVLSATNINCINENGIDALKRLDRQFDWIYLDPSRRDNTKRKVFLLSDCLPNAKTFQGLFLKYAKHIMIKTSPLLDLSATLLDLKHVKDIHIIALQNEVKEILWILERDYIGSTTIKTVNLTKKGKQIFNFHYNDESQAAANYSKPLAYLYEPNSAILKSGAFNSVAKTTNVLKLHKHSHLYTSEKLLEFPGRRFKIEKQLPFNKKLFSKENISNGNITTRNFPLSVGDIRKKYKVKDGGDNYLFFTTNIKNEKIILLCSKAL